VVLAGMLGGFSNTFLPAGTDVPSPKVIEALLKTKHGLQFVYHALRNAFFGGLASFMLWGGLNNEVSFSSTAISPLQVATSLAVGGGGLWVVNNFFRQYQKGAANANLADAIEISVKQKEKDNK
jgi:hypothetical protein